MRKPLFVIFCQRRCLCNSEILSSRRSALIRQPSCERVSSRGWVSMFPLSAWLWDQVGWVRGSHCHHKIKSLTAVFNIYQNSGNFTSKVIPKKENSLVNKLKKCIHFDYSDLWKRNWGVHFKPHPVRVALLIQTDPVRCDQLVNRPKSLTQCFDVWLAWKLWRHLAFPRMMNQETFLRFFFHLLFSNVKVVSDSTQSQPSTNYHENCQTLKWHRYVDLKHRMTVTSCFWPDTARRRDVRGSISSNA